VHLNPTPQLRTPQPIIIEDLQPEIDAGRHAAKRVVGDELEVSATIFKDGHDLLAARVRHVGPDGVAGPVLRMVHDPDTDRWSARFPLAMVGRYTITVEAWTDTFATWRSELEKKWTAGQDIHAELQDGALLLERVAAELDVPGARNSLRRIAGLLRDPDFEPSTRFHVGVAPELLAVVEEHAHASPHDLTAFERPLTVQVDRERARFAAWYEMFPRSATTDPRRHGTLAEATEQLQRIAGLGFDVVYLPPIHPIGLSNRKGRNNSLKAGPDEPGSPWAIGSADGGHTAVDPRLGTLADFDRYVARARELGLEVALDYALQCSPDHPWLKEHPEWFFVRPDGTIKYAENPPKKYQDIYPLNFWCRDRAGLWNACRDILLFWIARGVRTFRVDNPHTKAFSFWEWVIAEVHRDHPDIIFLAEAFTRPNRMRYLAKTGFNQSYTYFTWRNSASELRDYLTELTQGPMREYFRGNLWPNTPDILTEYLQYGGRPAHMVRLILAATLGPSYGIYGPAFELFDNAPLAPGKEEYLNSEKYEIRSWDLDRPDSLSRLIGRVNQIRHKNPAFRANHNLRFHEVENEQIIAYTKASTDGANEVLVVVNLDPHYKQSGIINLPLEDLGIDPQQPFQVHDLLTDARYLWHGPRNFVELDPRTAPAHIFVIRRRVSTEQDFDYFL